LTAVQRPSFLPEFSRKRSLANLIFILANGAALAQIERFFYP